MFHLLQERPLELLFHLRRYEDRVPLVQTCPVLKKFAIMAPSTALSISASGSTMTGLYAAELHCDILHALAALPATFLPVDTRQ